MNEKIHKQYLDLKYMDTLSQGKSILHKLDPRILLITTILFIVTVISFEKYTISALIPFFIYPTMLIIIGEMPLAYFIKKIIIVSPFILFFAILNPFFDHAVVMQIGEIRLSGGIISSISLVLRFILTISCGLLLIALIGIHGICRGLEKLYFPRVFITQILLLYRYLFILTEEVSKIILAKSLRQFNSKPLEFKTYTSILGHLFLRSLDRAERIYLSMCSRGFSGHIQLSKKHQIQISDIAFLIIWTFIFIVFRFFNTSLIFGKLLT